MEDINIRAVYSHRWLTGTAVTVRLSYPTCSQRPFLDLPRGAPGPWARATPVKPYILLLTRQPAHTPAASLSSGPPPSHSCPGSGFPTHASSPCALIRFRLASSSNALGSDKCHTSLALVSHSNTGPEPAVTDYKVYILKAL